MFPEHIAELIANASSFAGNLTSGLGYKAGDRLAMVLGGSSPMHTPCALFFFQFTDQTSFKSPPLLVCYAFQLRPASTPDVAGNDTADADAADVKGRPLMSVGGCRVSTQSSA